MDDFQELVYERLRTIPKDLEISIGGGTFSKEEALKHVKANDEIGKNIILINREYLAALTSGEIYADLDY